MSPRSALPVKAPALAALVLAATALWAPAWADCRIAGRVVVDGLPGADARISFATAEGERTVQADAEGAFALVLPRLPASRIVLVATIDRPPARGQFFLRRGESDGCPLPRERYELSTPAPGSSAQEGEEDLCVERSLLGRTVVLAPFAFFGEEVEALAARFNQDLRVILRHRIEAYQSRLGLPAADISADISVAQLCLSLSSADGERLRQIGGHLNALAVVAGEGELLESPGEGRVIELDSVFRTIPSFGGQGGLPVTIRDRIPDGSLRPSRVAEHLDDLWGKQALLAFALQRLGAGAGQDRPEERAALRRLLLAMRATMQAGEPLLEPTSALIALLEEEPR